MKSYEDRLDELFNELVPPYGKAGTVAGEIVRATVRIVYRYYNDGDHIGVRYGKETCNPAARYLKATCNGAVEQAISDAWGIYNDMTYEAALDNIEKTILDYLDQFPELKTTTNQTNMYDYATEEDRDDYDYDEEWSYDEE